MTADHIEAAIGIDLDGAVRGAAVAPGNRGREIGQRRTNVGIGECGHHSRERDALRRRNGRSLSAQGSVPNRCRTCGRDGSTAEIGNLHRNGVVAFIRVDMPTGNQEAAVWPRGDEARGCLAVSPVDRGREIAERAIRIRIGEGRYRS